MRIVINVTLACLFVFLAGFNVWNMLAGRNVSGGNGRLWTQIHRAVGYLFIALFAILCYLMLMRLKGRPDEISPQVALHMVLALLLGPLLFAKVISARYQRAARGLLMALGIAIFSVAFTLVVMNVAIHFLHSASADKVSGNTSEMFIFASLCFATIGFASRIRRPHPNAEKGTPSSDPPSIPERSSLDKPLHLILARIERQTHDAKTLRFLLPAGRQLRSRPGQFLTFELMIDGKPVTRSYSISSSPTQTGYVEITPRRVERGYVSPFLNDRAQVGLAVKVKGPYGQFYFDENKHKRIVLIAAGSGITPLMAMLRYIDDLCLPVDCVLIYCIRKEEDGFFLKELQAFQNRLSRLHVVIVVSQPSPNWKGWSGRLRREILDLEVENPLGSTFFLCGPPAFMSLGRSLLKDMSVNPDRILQESFGGAVPAEPSSSPDTGRLTVKFARSAVTYKMSPDETLLESSEKHGVLIPSGCRQGNCGTCVTKLLDGDVRMEPHEALSDQQQSQGYILPCVSRPLTDVTLDA